MNTILRAHVMSLAARPGGVRVDEVHGFDQRLVINSLARLAAAGKLHRAKLSHRHVRFFADAEARDAFVIRQRPAHFEVQRIDPVTGRSGGAARLPPSRAPALRAPWPADAPVVTPPGLQIQYGPSHPPIFAEHVLPFVHGGLRCA